MLSSTIDDLLRLVQEYLTEHYPHLTPEDLTIRFATGRRMGPLPFPVMAPSRGNGRSKAPARHSPDFRSVHWFGTDYVFSPTQAAVVRLLWQAWEDDVPNVGQDTLLEAAGSDGNRLRDVFRDHPSWQTFIISSSRGTFRLAEVD